MTRHGLMRAVCAALMITLTRGAARAAAPPVGGAQRVAVSSAVATETAPNRVIEQFNAALLGTLKDAERLGYQGRYDRLAPVIDATFDLTFMAEKSIGRRWRLLSNDERIRWLDTCATLTRANYAGRFDRYTGQQFEILGHEPGAHQTVVVRTRLINPVDDDVELNYRLRMTEGHWRVIDVYLKGTVSELALRRSEYASVLKRDGFDALIDTLDAKIARLAADDVAP